MVHLKVIFCCHLTKNILKPAFKQMTKSRNGAFGNFSMPFQFEMRAKGKAHLRVFANVTTLPTVS